MIDNFIQLEKDIDIIKIGIKTSDGKETGEYLEFDLDDVELPLKYQELLEKDKKNKEYLKNQITIIEKRQDVKGKKLLSKNEEDKIRAIDDFLRKETEIYNLFLGENGVQKLLNGKKLGWRTLQKIDEIIKKQIEPIIDSKLQNITEQVKLDLRQNKEDKEVLK